MEHSLAERTSMKLGILNSELGIAVIDGLEDLGYIQTERIKKQMPEGAKMNDLAFFYMADRDWIVINKAHELYEYYSEIIPLYLELSEEGRKKSVVAAPTETIKAAFYILDGVIADRALIYGKVGEVNA